MLDLPLASTIAPAPAPAVAPALASGLARVHRHSLRCTRALSLLLSRSCSLSLSRSLSHTLSRSLALALFLSLALSHTHSLALSLSLSLSSLSFLSLSSLSSLSLPPASSLPPFSSLPPPLPVSLSSYRIIKMGDRVKVSMQLKCIECIEKWEIVSKSQCTSQHIPPHPSFTHPSFLACLFSALPLSVYKWGVT